MCRGRQKHFLCEAEPKTNARSDGQGPHGGISHRDNRRSHVWVNHKKSPEVIVPGKVSGRCRMQYTEWYIR